MESNLRGISAEQRVLEYPNLFISQNNQLKCVACNEYVDHIRKGTIDDHLKSFKHIKNQNILNLQINKMDNYFTNKTAIKDFIKMFAKCNISLNNRDYMDDWLSKYMVISGAIPKANTLRSYYIPEVVREYDIELQEVFSKQNWVSICVDGTTDAKGRKYINIVLFGDNLEKPLLGKVNFVEIEDNVSISTSITNFLVLNKIDFRKVISIVTDNVEKNIIAVENIRNTYNMQILYIRYSNHVCNLFLEEIVDHEFFQQTHDFLTYLLELFSNNRVSGNYLEFMRMNNFPKEKIIKMPEYVKIRWMSWMGTINYVWEYFHILNLYILKFAEFNDQTIMKHTIKNLQSIINDENKLVNLKLNLAFLSLIYEQFNKTSLLFESVDNPQIFYAVEHFENINTLVKNFRDMESFDQWTENIKKILTEAELVDDFSFFNEIMQNITSNTIRKIKKYKDLDYYQYLYYFAFFNPRYLMQHKQFYFGHSFLITNFFSKILRGKSSANV